MWLVQCIILSVICYYKYLISRHILYDSKRYATDYHRNKIGFCEAQGDFDTVIDTLGDEAKLNKVRTLSEGNTKSRDTGLAAKLKRDNKCDR